MDFAPQTRQTVTTAHTHNTGPGVTGSRAAAIPDFRKQSATTKQFIETVQRKPVASIQRVVEEGGGAAEQPVRHEDQIKEMLKNLEFNSSTNTASTRQVSGAVNELAIEKTEYSRTWVFKNTKRPSNSTLFANQISQFLIGAHAGFHGEDKIIMPSKIIRDNITNISTLEIILGALKAGEDIEAAFLETPNGKHTKHVVDSFGLQINDVTMMVTGEQKKLEVSIVVDVTSRADTTKDGGDEAKLGISAGKKLQGKKLSNKNLYSLDEQEQNELYEDAKIEPLKTAKAKGTDDQGIAAATTTASGGTESEIKEKIYQIRSRIIDLLEEEKGNADDDKKIMELQAKIEQLESEQEQPPRAAAEGGSAK